MLRVESMKLLNERVVDLSLNDREAVIITGKNGTGKSLFLKSLARLIPSTFKTFQYDKKNITDIMPELFRSQVMYVSTTPFFPGEGKVEDFFQSAFDLTIYKDFTPRFPFDNYLKEWNLAGVEFSRLSSGQKQMVSILRALSLRPKILLLDEPTANLDQEKTLEIETLLETWRRNTGGSFIMISHSKEQTERLALRLLPF
jgi:putative ABC transport system ATP-binding protein